MGMELSDDVITTIKSGAAKLTGFERRQYLAEVAMRYCDGSPYKTERKFGWGRETVRTGLGELRTGIRCLENFSARGRKKCEEDAPQLIDAIKRIVDPHAQADPKFQTPLAFTRITAKAVRDELLQQSELRSAVPSRQTVGELLNRLGYRLRRVLKTRPEKRLPKQMPSSKTSKPAA